MIFIADPFRQIFRDIGFTEETIFTEASIKPWRQLADRENCTWDISALSGKLRLHVKRFPPLRSHSLGSHSPAKTEAAGYALLHGRGIPTAAVAAWGILEDGRSFIAMEDLAGFTPADKLIASGVDFERLLVPTADLAAHLHAAGLHHRDLYLCHFMARVREDTPPELRLIDAARVKPLPGMFFRRRWIVKDLAQFWYSATQLSITDSQRNQWLERYGERREIGSIDRLRRSIMRKVEAIAAHDARLNVREPSRNVSIPKLD